MNTFAGAGGGAGIAIGAGGGGGGAPKWKFRPARTASSSRLTLTVVPGAEVVPALMLKLPRSVSRYSSLALHCGEIMYSAPAPAVQPTLVVLEFAVPPKPATGVTFAIEPRISPNAAPP